MKGVFITFEGIDGAGKSTQARLLADRIEASGRRVLRVRDPGATELAERVRPIILDPEMRGISPMAELMLYLACRAQLADELIRPALADGAVVISDRYGDSSVAYQGYGRELGPELVRQSSALATGGLDPDITFLIDLPLGIARKRRGTSAPDRLEGEIEAFHQRIRDGFLDIANRNPGRVVVVDGSMSESDIAQYVVDALTDRFPGIVGSQPE